MIKSLIQHAVKMVRKQDPLDPARVLRDTELVIVEELAKLDKNLLLKLAGEGVAVKVKTVHFGEWISDEIAGLFDLESKIIFIDYRLPADVFMGTVLHELAHFLTFRAKGQRNTHDAYWRRVNSELGGSVAGPQKAFRATLTPHMAMNLSIFARDNEIVIRSDRKSRKVRIRD